MSPQPIRAAHQPRRRVGSLGLPCLLALGLLAPPGAAAQEPAGEPAIYRIEGEEVSEARFRERLDALVVDEEPYLTADQLGEDGVTSGWEAQYHAVHPITRVAYRYTEISREGRMEHHLRVHSIVLTAALGGLFLLTIAVIAVLLLRRLRARRRGAAPPDPNPNEDGR